MKTLDKLEHADFAPYMNQQFTFETHAGEIFEVELVEIKEYKHSSKAREEQGKRKPFSVFFRGAADPIREQRMYRLNHGTLGTLDIFLVPVGRDEKTSGIVYEAGFN